MSTIPLERQSECIKVFINEAGILRHQLPTERKENELLTELNRLMESPFPSEVVEETRRLLASDRIARASMNTKLMFKRPRPTGVLKFLFEKER